MDVPSGGIKRSWEMPGGLAIFCFPSRKFIVQKSWRIFKPRFDISKNRLFVSLCQNGWATKICQERTGIDHESRRIKMAPCVLGASFYLILGWHPSLAHTMFSLSHLWADDRRYGISSPFATKIDTYIIHILEDLLVSRFWRCAFHHQTCGTRLIYNAYKLLGGFKSAWWLCLKIGYPKFQWILIISPPKKNVSFGG